VPFDGESAGEILMKHLTSPPDLSKVPTEYVGVVGKSLAKNPAHRFTDMAEMGQALDAAIGKTTAPEKEPAARARFTRPSPPPPPAAAQGSRRSPEPVLEVLPVLTRREHIAELCGSLTMTTLFAAVAFMIWAAVASHDDSKLTDFGSGFFLTVAACWAVLIPAKFWNRAQGDSGFRRCAMMMLGLLVGLGAYWLHGGLAPIPSLEGWTMAAGVNDRPFELASQGSARGFAVAAQYLSYFGLVFFLLRWWKLADRNRTKRFSFGPVFAVGFWSVILFAVFFGIHSDRTGLDPMPMCLPLLLSAIIVQLVSPWEQPAAPVGKRMRLKYS
jgi:eukaryotic-like serine/threonine-protein kinase